MGVPESSKGSPKQRTFVERARRAQIVEAAIETIAELGYASASLARIAERAGVSTALVSYYFDGRDDLMVEVMSHNTSRLDDVMTDAAAGAANYVDALRMLIESMVGYFASNSKDMIALGQIYLHARPGTPTGERAALEHRQGIDELAQMFCDGQQHGDFRAFDTRTMAIALMATLEATPGELLADDNRDSTDYGAEIAELFVRATRTDR